MDIFPYRIRYAKKGRLRFLSHHDLLRFWERAVRRSEIPIRFSQGHNPRPTLSFPTALGVGIESEDEILEVELSTWVSPRQIREQLSAQLPEGIEVRAVEPFLRRDRTKVDFVEYEAALAELPEDLPARIEEMMARDTLVVPRRTEEGSRPVDIRPYLMAIEVEERAILLRLRVTDEGTARVEEVLQALGLPWDGRVRVGKTYTELARRDPPPRKRRPPAPRGEVRR